MASGLKVTVEASNGFSGVASALDENVLVARTGAGFTLMYVTQGRQAFVAPPTLRGISASAVCQQTKSVIASVSTRDGPAILVYPPTSLPSRGTPGGGAPRVISLPQTASTDTTITALAVSRDGKRIVSFGGAPDMNLSVFDGETGEPCTSSEITKAPGLVTVASVCPGNPDLLAASGPSGIYFYRMNKSFTNLEMTVTHGEIPQSSSSSSSSLGNLTGGIESTSEALIAAAASKLARNGINRKGDALFESQQASERAILEFVAESVAADAAGAGVTSIAAETATAAVADRRGRNTWLSHAWIRETSVAAANGDGDIVIFHPTTGKIIRRISVESLGASRGSIATSVAATSSHLLVGCSDGYLRYLVLPSVQQEDESITVATTGTAPAANASLYPLVGSVKLAGTTAMLPGSTDKPSNASQHHLSSYSSHVVAGNDNLGIASISVSPSYSSCFVGTYGGTVHQVPATGVALTSYLSTSSFSTKNPVLALTKSLSSSSSSSAAATGVKPLTQQAPIGSIVATAYLSCVASFDGVSQGSLTAAGASTYYNVTASEDGILRVWASESGSNSASSSSTDGSASVLKLVAKVAVGSVSIVPSAYGASSGSAAASLQTSDALGVSPAVEGEEQQQTEASSNSSSSSSSSDTSVTETKESKDGDDANIVSDDAAAVVNGDGDDKVLDDVDGTVIHPAINEEASVSSASGPQLVTEFVSRRVVTMAAHPRFPILAVGCSDGSVIIYLVAKNPTTNDFSFYPVYADNAHTSAVTALLFTEVVGEKPLLVSVSALGRLLVVHDISCAIVAAVTPAATPEETFTMPAVIAYARLPARQEEHAVTSLCWASVDSTSLLLGCASGHLLHVTLPSSYPASGPLTLATQAIDLTPSVHVRSRLASGVTSVVVAAPATASAGQGGAVAFVALAGEMSISVVPLDTTTSPVQEISNMEDADAFAAIPAASGDSYAKLNAHKRSGLSLALSPLASVASSVILASGGTDGAVTLLALSVQVSAGGAAPRISVTGSSYTPLHAGAVTSVRFSPDGKYIAAVAALDGVVGTVSLSGDVVTKAESTALTAMGARALPKTIIAAGAEGAEVIEGLCSVAPTTPEAVVARYMPSSLGLLTAVAAAQEAAAAREHAVVHAELLAEVEMFRAKLRNILAANASAPALERLERTEFVIDQVGADNIVAEYDGLVAARREAYAQEYASLDADLARIRSSCVDTADVLACEVRALTTEAAVKNFPIRKRRNSEQALLEKIATLRTVEISASADAGMEVVASTVGGSNASPTWKGLSSRIPADIDWIYHAGLLAPTTEPAKQHEDAISRSSVTANDKKAPAAAAAGAGGKTSNAAASSDGGEAGGDGGAEGGGGGGAGGGGGEKDDSKEAKGVRWEGEAVIHLLYHPTAVRTPAQKRTQVALLGELLRATRAKFNSTFEKLKGEKHEALDQIKSRHARIRDILTELGTPVVHMTEKDTRASDFTAGTGGDISAATLYAAGYGPGGIPLGANGRPRSAAAADGADRPKSAKSVATNVSEPNPLTSVPATRTPIGPVPGEGGTMFITDPILSIVEDPAALTKVTDAEIGMGPYVSPAEVKRRQEEADSRRRAAAANKDDANERALMDMMGGTLEGKDELTALAESLVREPWMDEVPEADFSPDQKTVYAAYKMRLQAFEDEKAKARNALNSELTKLLGELKEIVALFDEKVTALVKTRTTTASILAAQELYMSKLTSAVQLRLHGAARDTALQMKFEELIPAESIAAEAHETFKVDVERQATRVEEFTSKDKLLDSGFRGAIKDAVGVLESDVVKALVSLFRKRDTAAVAAAVSAANAAAAAKIAAASATAAGSATPGSPAPSAASPVVASPGGMQRQNTMLKRAGTVRRLSNGNNSNMTAGGVSGAAAAATAVDPFAYYATNLSKLADEEARTASLREAALLPLSRADCPEGYNNLPDEPVWEVLNNLRREKVASEQALADEIKVLESMKSHLALLASRFEMQKAKIDATGAERDAIASAWLLAQVDVETLLRLRMGQDEVSANHPDGRPHPGGGDALVEWSDAMLLPGDVVEAVNLDIRKLGQVKVDHLSNIKSFKKGLRYQQWEAQYRQARARDESEFFRDLQLMRAVGTVKDFITGVNVASKARQEVDKAEAKLAHFRRSHIRSLANLEKSAARLDKEVAERAHGLQALDKQTESLREAVALREAILRSRKGGGGGGTSGNGGSGSITEADNAELTARAGAAMADKMQGIAIRAKLGNVAKAQKEELFVMGEELKRLRERNYAAL